MKMDTTITFESETTFDSQGTPEKYMPDITDNWRVTKPPQQGSLVGQASLLLGIGYGDPRSFLLMFAEVGDDFRVFWDGLNEVNVPSLFYTTDNGYEVTAGGVVTPIDIDNAPTKGGYRFFQGEAEDEQYDYPTGTFSGEETVP